MSTLQKSPRIEVVDALRGFAILSIMLLHNIEHFDFYFFPEDLPNVIKTFDGYIWTALFFLFGGKSYAIFALLFGLTFFIQFNNRQKAGSDFSGRFLWRLFLLLIFGVINSVFFEGDILAFYAVIGVVLIPVRRLNDTVVLVIAILLMLQPVEWLRFLHILGNPDYVEPAKVSNQYFAKIPEYLGGSSFWQAAWGNLTNGRIAVVHWTLENGRVFQTASLFMMGMLLGRTTRFYPNQQNNSFWKKALLISAIAFVPLFLLNQSINDMVAREVLRGPLVLIVTSWSNFAFMVVLVSAFVLLYQRKLFYKALSRLMPLGKMSLSNYVMQSILGSFVYYGYGLGLFRYTGATYSLLIGIVLAGLQIWFCKWWFQTHSHGPLERLWHKATWVRLKGN